jgi:formamidopyrimidine-DNA glycosylase
MPELPDVEVYRGRVAATALHQKIAGVEVRSASILEGDSRRRLSDTLEGRRFESVARHGKHLFVSVSGRGFLPMHFGMPGPWITPRRRKDDACPACGGGLEKIRVSDRSAYCRPKDQQG